jgi:hypothetical protein
MPASVTQGLSRVKILTNSRLTKKVSGLAIIGQRKGAHLLEVRTYTVQIIQHSRLANFSLLLFRKVILQQMGRRKVENYNLFNLIFSLALASANLLLSRTFLQVSVRGGRTAEYVRH